MKRSKLGIIFVSLGLLLIGLALGLYLHNREEDKTAGFAAEGIVQELQMAITASPAVSIALGPSPGTEDIEDEETPVLAAESAFEELPVAVVDGYEYIGYLHIPDLALNLPIMAQWDYSRLQIAPCRQFGSPLTDDFVIAAHNYDSHFGALKNLSVGALLSFTDMNGTAFKYKMEVQSTIAPTEVDAVRNSGYALVLYTCTKGGTNRVALFFSRASKE